MKSNLSVGPPIDILCYKKDSLRVGSRIRLEEGHPYLKTIRQLWSAGLTELVQTIPKLDFPASEAQEGDHPVSG